MASDRLHRTLSRLVDVRADEVAALLLGFGYFFCLLASYYLLRPLRDAMGLAGGPGELQWLFTATFAVMLLAVPLYGVLTTRLPPSRFVPRIYRFFALNALAFAALFASGWRELDVARVFYVWTSVFNLFVVTVFWSVMVDCWRNEQGRRLFGFIAAGGTAGALLGPALTAALVGPLGPAGLAVISALLLEAAVRCVGSLQRRRAGGAIDPARAADGAGGDAGWPADRRLGGTALAGVRAIAGSRYLQGIVAYVLLLSTSATFLYFIQAQLVAARFAETAERARFFAAIDLAVNLLTLLLQVAGTARFIRRFGVARTLCGVPLVSTLAAGCLLLWPQLGVMVAMQSLRRGAEYALARPARELLFVVLDREAKYKAKSAIETFVYRGGDAASGWLFSALAGLGGHPLALALLIPAGAAWTVLAVALGRQQELKAERMNQPPSPYRESLAP